MFLLSAKIKCRNCLSQKCDCVFLTGSFLLQNTPFPHLIFPYHSNNLSLGFVEQSLPPVGYRLWLILLSLMKTTVNKTELLLVAISFVSLIVSLHCLFDARLCNFFPKQLSLIFTLQLTLSFSSLHRDQYSIYSKSENTAYFSCPQRKWSSW